MTTLTDVSKLTEKIAKILSPRLPLMIGKRAWLAPALLMGLLLGYHVVFERANIYMFAATTAQTMCLVAAVTLLTRRLNLALFLAAAFIALVVVMSAIKTTFLSMALHAYDLVFYLGSSGTVRFLITDFPLHVAALLMLAGILLASGWVVYQRDGTRIPPAASFAGLVILAVFAYTVSAAGKPPPLEPFPLDLDHAR